MNCVIRDDITRDTLSSFHANIEASFAFHRVGDVSLMSMAATYGAAILILDSSEMSFDNLDILARFARRAREERWGVGIESLDGIKKILEL